MKKLFRVIELTKGKLCKVDEEDFDFVSSRHWHYMNVGYAATNKIVNGKRTIMTMHRLLLCPKKGQEVDHINGDKLDNRRSNLRLCSSSQNKWNRPWKGKSSSRYKGVALDKRRGVWVAKITKNYVARYLGSFTSEIGAARAYNKSAKEIFGKYSYLNRV